MTASPDLHLLASKVSNQSPAIKACLMAIADVVQPVTTAPPPTPTPTPSPSKRVPHGYWDSPTGSPDIPGDFVSKYHALGFDAVFCGADASQLKKIAAVGGKAWINMPLWRTPAEVAQWLPSAAAVGNAMGIYIADDENVYAGNVADVLTRHNLVKDLLKTVAPNVPTVVSHYDPAVLKALVGKADILAIDYYPCRTGSSTMDVATLKKCVAACAGSRFVGCPQGFGGFNQYRMPTPDELQAQFDFWATTSAEALFLYAFGTTGAPTKLEDHADLMAVVKAWNA